MSEVILIYIYDEEIIFVQQATLYLGSYLKKNGIDVKLFNFFVDESKMPCDKDLNALKEELNDCICLGFSVMTPQVTKSLELSKIIKSLKPEIKIVWGGTHPTLFPVQTLENPNIDFAIKGEGEEVLLKLVQELKSSKPDFSRINGLVFKDRSSIISNQPQGVFEDFVNLSPDWDLMLDFVAAHMAYFFGGKSRKSVAIHTGRGCPYRCTFCINNILFGKSRRTKPIDLIIREIKIVLQKFNPDLINIMDDNFFINKKFVEDFCARLKEEGMCIKWFANSRVNYFDNFDDEFLSKLRDSGCISLGFGAESGSKKILSYLKKDITPEQIYDAAVKCVKYDIIPIFSFMTGLPRETKEDRLETMRLIKKLQAVSNKVAFNTIQIIRPYPGGELYQDCLKYGLYEPKTLEDWENKSKVSLGYLNPADLPWIDCPGDIEIISKYYSKSMNNYLLLLDVNPLLKNLFRIRTKLFGDLSYAYAKSDNQNIKKLLNYGLKATEKVSNLGKPVAIKNISELRTYK
ncbi:MAG: B12-binding domain-containing radical SAM protein [Nanoarchaeota archaeon]|nr:B12-binding domain-containing radical SAM protein [Nanoarchaeota archaeon]